MLTPKFRADNLKFQQLFKKSKQENESAISALEAALAEALQKSVS